MAYLDPKDAFEHLKERTLEGIKEQFPLKGKLQTLELEGLEVKDALHPDDLRAQHKAKVDGDTWSVPVYAQLKLKDNNGNVIDSRRIRVAEIPKTTGRYSYIVGGKEYQVDNQWQLKPGVYVRRRRNGVLETRFNVTDKRPFDLVFDPNTKAFHMEYGGSRSRIPLYPLLRTMGVDDAAIKKAWGDQVFKSNADIRGGQKALEAFYKADRRVAATTKEEAASHFYNTMLGSRLRSDATQVTLGKPLSNVTGEALQLASEKMLKVQRGMPEDDRDNLIFKDLRSTGDFVYDKLRGARRTIQAKAQRKLNTAKDVRDVLKFDFFNAPVREAFTKNSASRTAAQINPLEMVSAASQTTVMGEGGIKSERSVNEEAKFVNPSHLGFLDPINTPEGEKTGVTLRLPIGLHKVGHEAKIPLYDLRSHSMQLVSPGEFASANVVLPDQVTWKDGKPVPVSSVVRMSATDNQIRDGKFSDAHYVMRRSSQLFNMTSNLIPFLGSTSGNRAAMASRQMEQAISLVHREPPLVQVGTGVEEKGLETFESLMGQQASHRSPSAGKVIKVNKDAIVVEGTDGQPHEVQLYNNFPLNDAKGVMHSTPVVSVGDVVKKNQLLADTNFSKNGTLALGTNLRVAYLPFKGYNFEDGIVISESAAKKLASEHLQKNGMPLDDETVLNKRRYEVEHPGMFKREQLAKLDEHGIVREGQKVHPGDPLIAATKPFNLKDRTGLGAIRRKMSGAHTDRSLRWDSEFDGEVVGVHRSKAGITVHVRTTEPMQVGDKLAGRYGDKGIVTMVLPDQEMPHTKDGKHIEVALNPSGVPGRMNPSQLLETAAAKIAEKTGKTYVVHNFSPGYDALATIQKDLRDHGLSDTEELFDPVTKHSLGQVMVGPKYTHKLVHQVEKKLSVRSGMDVPGAPKEAYDLNLQPASGGGTGGQSMGTLGLYALLAHGAKANIREMQTYKSEGPDSAQTNPAKRWPSDHNQIWGAIATGNPLPPPKTTFAFQKFTDMLRGAGINIDKKGHSLVLSPLTDDQIKTLAKKELPKPTEILFSKLDSNGDPKPKPGGLFDETLTGGHGGRNWTRITLSEPVPNPIFEGAITSLLDMKRKDYLSLVHGETSLSAAGHVVEGQSGITGGAAIKHLLDKVDVVKELPRAEAALKSSKESGVDKALKRVKYLRALRDLKYTPSQAYILHNLPVVPPAIRPASLLPNGDLKFDDLNQLYSDFAKINDKLRDPILSKNLTESGKQPLRQSYYDGVKALMGLGARYQDAEHKGLLHKISGNQPKTGYFQNVLMNRRQDMTMRSTIVPEPALGLDEVGLPKHAALDLFRPFVVRKLREMGAIQNELQGPAFIAKQSPQVWRALERVMDERPVLMKRDPALHKYSVQAFRPRAVEGNAVKIHPLVTGGFNADFNGDSCSPDTRILYRLQGQVFEASFDDLVQQLLPGITEEELLQMAAGATAILTLDRGLEVLSWIPGTGMCWCTVSELTVHTSHGAAYEVVTRNGRRAVVSEHHNFGVVDQNLVWNKVKTDAMKAGMLIPFVRKTPVDEHPTLPIVKGWEPPADFGTGWFFGYYAGDGSITGRNDTISLACGFDEKHPLLAEAFRHVGLSSWDEPGKSVRCSTQKDLALEMKSLFGHGAANKRVPGFIFQTPRSFREGFIAGFLDAEGNVQVGTQGGGLVRVEVTSRALLEGVLWVLTTLGIGGYLREGKKATATTQKTWVLTIAREDFEDLPSPLFSDKARILSEIIATSRSLERTEYDLVPFNTKLVTLLLDRGKHKKTQKVEGRHYRAKELHKYGKLGYLTRSAALRVLEKYGDIQDALFQAWKTYVLDFSTGWTLVESVQETTRPHVMYDFSVPEGNETFSIAGGLVTRNTMSIFVPITREAVAEAHKMYPSNNLLSEATGQVMYQPTLESALGLYKLSLVGKKTGKKFEHPGQVLDAVRGGHLHVNDVVHLPDGDTTAGRVLISAALPDVMQKHYLHDLNYRINKDGLNALFTEVGQKHAPAFGETANKLKDLGNGASFGMVGVPKPTAAGHSFTFSKMEGTPVASFDRSKNIFIPMGSHSLSLKDFTPDRSTREHVLAPIENKVHAIQDSNLSQAEKDRQSIALYKKAELEMKKLHEEKQDKNPSNLFTMYRAGVKPQWTQYKQMVLAPMIYKDSLDREIPTPVTKSYAEGFDVGSYWTQMHGARRGAVMKVQEVRDPGYMSKLLMNTMMNILVNNHDCGTTRGVSLDVSDKDVHDRFLQQDFRHGKLNIPAGTLLTPDVIGAIRTEKKDAKLLVRSPLKCEEEHGICQKCAGVGPGGQPFDLGTNIGVLSAHALGERAVQLTLKSFHEGGVSGQSSKVLNSFGRLRQLLYLPEKIPDEASLARSSGKIEKILPTATGVDVFINGLRHHVGRDAAGAPLHEELPNAPAISGYQAWQPPKVGMHVEAGQNLSDPNRTFINPRHLYEATGAMEKVQNHLTNEIYGLYEKEGVRRRAIETAVKAMSNLTEVVDPGDHESVLRGEYHPLSSIFKMNKDLKAEGKKPIEHKPVMKGIEVLPLELHEDWMAKMQHKNLRNTLIDAASTVGASLIHGTHPVPAIAFGAEVGLTSKDSLRPGFDRLKDVPTHHY